MTEINPHKILIGIRAEQIKNGDPSFLVNLLSGFEEDTPENLKSLRGSVSLMFPNVNEYPLAFLMWTLSLNAKYKNIAYFLEKESIDFINERTLNEEAKKIPLNYFTERAINFGIKHGYSKEEMLDYFNITSN